MTEWTDCDFGLFFFFFSSCLLVGSKTEYHFAETTEVAAHMDIETGNGIDASKGGIDHLLRPSSVNRSGSLEELEYGP